MHRAAVETAGGGKGRQSDRRQAARQQESRAAPRALRQEGAKNGRPSASGCREIHAPTDGLFETFVADTPVCRALCARRGAARESRPKTPEPSRSAVRVPCRPQSLPSPFPHARFVSLPHRSLKRSRNVAETRLPTVYCQRCGAVFSRL